MWWPTPQVRIPSAGASTDLRVESTCCSVAAGHLALCYSTQPVLVRNAAKCLDVQHCATLLHFEASCLPRFPSALQTLSLCGLCCVATTPQRRSPCAWCCMTWTR